MLPDIDDDTGASKMEIPTQRCGLVGKAPKVSKLQKPQPRKQVSSDKTYQQRTLVQNNEKNNQQTKVFNDNGVNVISKECVDLQENNNFFNNNDISRRLGLEETNGILISSLNNQNHEVDIDVNANKIADDDTPKVDGSQVKKRAPRGNKLVRPPPLKGKSLPTSSEALEVELLNYVERLMDDKLSLSCMLQFRDFICKNGAQMENTNKGLIDKCFDCIQEAITRSTLDSVVEINLKDILILRRLNWQSPALQNEINRHTWKDIMENTSDTGDKSNGHLSSRHNTGHKKDSLVHEIQTQQSTDSGFSEMDEILWESDCEEEYLREMQEMAKGTRTEVDDVPEADDPKNKDSTVNMKQVEEVLAGLKIVGKSEDLVKEATQILRSHFTEKKQLSPPPVSAYIPPPPPQSLPQPTEKTPFFEMGYRLPSSPLASTPSPDPFMMEKSPFRFNRQLSEEQKKCVITVIRQPVGPGISDNLQAQIEKNMPDGKFTAKGRRAMFSCYHKAMEGAYPEPEANCNQYTREELLYYSDSLLAKIPPTEWSYLSMIFPGICLMEVDSYFSKNEHEQNLKKQLSLRLWHVNSRSRLSSDSEL